MYGVQYAVCGLRHFNSCSLRQCGSVRQCTELCAAVCAAVCGCPAVRAAVCGCQVVRQYAAGWECAYFQINTKYILRTIFHTFRMNHII
jgi:hypothetical protein